MMNRCYSLLLCLLASFAPPASADWPDFRGPTFDGHVPKSGTNQPALPLRWSETENVKWKTAIPHRGWSSPVILGKQIWLTTATTDGHDFFAVCVDSDSGNIIFNERVFHSDAPEPLGNAVNCYASPSPVIEPGRVFVHFGSYGTACLNADDFKVIWKRDDLPCRHYRGPGSSPILFGDVLILTMDGIDFQYVVALDKKTGRTVWKTDRTADWNDIETDGRPRGDGDLRKAYSTPLVADFAGGKQLLTVGSKAAYSYDPQTGREIWKVNHAGFSTASRPLFDGTNAIFVTGHGKGETLAVRATGSGDVTATNILWRVSRGSPRMSSPVQVGDLVFMVTDSGIASCLEAATGKEVWQERIEGGYSASLLYANERLYCFSQDHDTLVLRPSRKFEVLAKNNLDEGFMASPAVSGNALYLRTRTQLYRVEEGAVKP